MSYVENWQYYPIVTFLVASFLYLCVIGVYYLVNGHDRFMEVRGAFWQIYQVTMVFIVGFSFVVVAGNFIRWAPMN